MQKRLESLRVGPPGLVRVSSLVRWLASLQAQLLRVQGAAGPVAMGAGGMAKAKSKQVVLRLMSQAGTGYYYTFRTTLKGVREKCAHPTPQPTPALPPPPPPPPFCLLVPWPPPLPPAPTPPLPSVATATFPAIATATLTLRQRLHPRLLPSPPPPSPPAPSPPPLPLPPSPPPPTPPPPSPPNRTRTALLHRTATLRPAAFSVVSCSRAAAHAQATAHEARPGRE